MDYIMIKLTILVHVRQNGGHFEFWSFSTFGLFEFFRCQMIQNYTARTVNLQKVNFDF